MEQTRCVNLPIVGRIQHGEKIEGKGATELGYFIAKVQDVYMQTYLEKFDKLYKGKKSIDIELFNEEPLSVKYARYNQSGEVCYCMANTNIGNQKTRNGWKPIECNPSCQYKQKNELGKSACNRIGWFKFLIPSICKDRIFLMRITGQTSINRLEDYFNLQKMQGNSIRGKYTLFLKQEEQSNSLGQTFNNYVLDIFKKEDLIPIEQLPKEPENLTELSTDNSKNVNNIVKKAEHFSTATQNSVNPKNNIANNQKQQQKKQLELEQTEISSEKLTKQSTNITKEPIRKETKNKSKKATGNEPEEITLEQQNTNIENNLSNCYALLNTFNEVLVNKDGEPKEYLIGEFADMEDRITNIVIRPEDAPLLSECDLGTIVRLEIQEKIGRKFAIKLEFIEKILKKAA